MFMFLRFVETLMRVVFVKSTHAIGLNVSKINVNSC